VRPLLLANARLVRWVLVTIDRAHVHSVLASVFILHARKNCEACFFLPISSRPNLSRILRSFSTSRQIRFHYFLSDLFANTLGIYSLSIAVPRSQNHG